MKSKFSKKVQSNKSIPKRTFKVEDIEPKAKEVTVYDKVLENKDVAKLYPVEDQTAFEEGTDECPCPCCEANCTCCSHPSGRVVGCECRCTETMHAVVK